MVSLYGTHLVSWVYMKKVIQRITGYIHMDTYNIYFVTVHIIIFGSVIAIKRTYTED